MEKICGIYCIENLVNQKKYIGQSIHILRRWNEHKNELNKNQHINQYLQNAWNKYGECNFLFSIIEKCEERDLDNKEIFYIGLFKSFDKDYGYNLNSGGSSGRYLTDDVRLRMSESKIGSLNSFYGKHHTEEVKEKLKFIKSNMSDETKRLMRENHADVSGKNNPNAKKVFCIELNQIFDTISEGAIFIGLKPSTLITSFSRHNKSCGKHPSTNEPLHWLYLEDAIKLGYVTQQND